MPEQPIQPPFVPASDTTSQQSDQPALLLLIYQLQQEIQNQHAAIVALQNDVRRLQNQPSASPRTTLPDPPRFDGKTYTLRTWLPSIRAKLRSDQREGSYAFDYVWDRLEQSQQASVLHLRQIAEDTQSWDPEVLFSYFQRLCHNPREHQEAVQRFSSVRQRDDESLVAYLARFERFAFEADAIAWPDVARVTVLHRGLRPSLRQNLEESEDSLFSLSYDSYVEQVQRIDHRSRRHYQPQQSQPAQTSQNQSQPARQPQLARQPARQSSPDRMDVSVNRVVPKTVVRASTVRITTPSSRRSSIDRQDHRRSNDLCFYCGSSDHWIDTCPDRFYVAAPPPSAPLIHAEGRLPRPPSPPNID